MNRLTTLCVRAVLGAALCFVASGIANAALLGPSIRLKGGQSLEGRFVHEHPVEGFDKPMRSEGRFSVNADGEVVWSIERPMMTKTVINAAGLSQSVGTFVLFRVTPKQRPFLAEATQQLMTALSGDWSKLRGDYVISTLDRGKGGWQVTLAPRPARPGDKIVSKPFRKLVALGEGPFVTSADVTLPSGTVDKIVFTDVKIEE